VGGCRGVDYEEKEPNWSRGVAGPVAPGVFLYLSNSTVHSSTVDGSLDPESFHSVIDSPDRVKRVYLLGRGGGRGSWRGGGWWWGATGMMTMTMLKAMRTTRRIEGEGVAKMRMRMKKIGSR
jgi:hypothetical protein